MKKDTENIENKFLKKLFIMSVQKESLIHGESVLKMSKNVKSIKRLPTERWLLIKDERGINQKTSAKLLNRFIWALPTCNLVRRCDPRTTGQFAERFSGDLHLTAYVGQYKTDAISPQNKLKEDKQSLAELEK